MAKTTRRKPGTQKSIDRIGKLQRPGGNAILNAMSNEDYAALEPHLERRVFKFKQSVETPFMPPAHVCFVLSGILSMLTMSGNNNRLEVGLVGREGMSGHSVVMGVGYSTYELFVQLEGEGLCIEASKLKDLLEDRPSLHYIFLRYFYVLGVQTSFTALANGRNKVEERLARWILMADDRTDGNELVLTHDFLSLMLGVRRAGVTEALHILEGEGLIKSLRGRVIVKSRKGLLKVASDIYGAPEVEAERLGFGSFKKKSQAS
jgi:CRP-like cAMP-binding protein